MIVGVPKETLQGETRVAATPAIVKKLKSKGLSFYVEKSAGEKAGFLDSDYEKEGAEIVPREKALGADIIFKIQPPTADDILKMKKSALLLSMMNPFVNTDLFPKLAEMGVSTIAMELIPRTSRAQSMDVLSSQANIAGYRAVFEAAMHFPRFVPMMMTSAGMAKPARAIVLGVGVAGLQAISGLRRLGAKVEAFDVRPEVKEQIISLGAKPIELELDETGSGSGGYAKALSEDGQRKQQNQLAQKIKGADIVITTANIPGRKAPILVTEEAVQGMNRGGVIVDMAAANGGNCPLSEADQVCVKHGITIIGFSNLAAKVPDVASQFYANNLVNLLSIMLSEKNGKTDLNIDLNDDIVAASLTTHHNEVRFKSK